MSSSMNKGYEDYAAQAEGSDSDRGVLTGSRKATFGTRAKRHCRRFWWLDLLIAVVIILVVLLPILFVGIKHVAQSELNKAVMNVTYEGLADPRPDSIQLTLKTSITSHSSYTPVIDSFNGSLFLENTEPNIEPFGYINIPRTQAEAVTNVTVEQKMAIADMDQFIAFNKIVMNSEEFRVALRGKTRVELSGLPHYDVDYNKVVTMKGLNKLSGFSITNTQIKLTPEPDGATLLGQVSIPNPSVFSIQMGNVTMNLYTTNKTYIGYTLIEDLTLNPGSNLFNMRSYVNLTQAIPFVVDKVLPLEIVGNSSVNAAGEHLPYFEAAIRDNVINYRLNIG